MELQDVNKFSFASHSSFLLILFLSSIFSAKADIHVGAIVNTNARIGREQKVAFEIAAQHFNSSSSSPLFLSISDLSSGDPLEISTTAQGLINWGAEAIIGTGTWPEVAALTRVGNTARIPVISLATTTPTFSSGMPFLVQMSYSASAEVKCLVDIIRSYNWRRVIVIYEDDLYGSISGVVALLSDALRASGSQIDHHIAFPPLHTTSNSNAVDRMIRQKLKSIPPQLSKVFVVLRSSPQMATDLFKVAKELHMMVKDHVWIVNDDVTSLLDSTLDSSFISSYMQGVIGISAYFDKTTSFYHNFSSEFRQRFKHEYEGKGEYHFEPAGLYAVRAYDAVHAVARAAAEAEKKRITLLQGILSNTFSGLSGVPGGRSNSSFRVLNVVGKSYRELGFWLERFGFYEKEEEMGQSGSVLVDVFRPVFWPGGIEKTPGGWGRLRIGVPNHTTFDQFVKVEYYNNTRRVKKVTGFCIDVFEEILKHLNYSIFYEFIPIGGSYDDLVNQVPLKNVDAVVGDITILAKRSVNVSFTEPFLSSGLSMLVPVKPNRTPWMLTKPFTKEVWFLILASLVYTGGVVWYLERKNSPEFDGAWRVQLGATLWLIFSTIFFAHGRIYSYYTKTVIIAWILVVWILTSSFTANLSSILISEKLEPVPPGSRVGCDGDSFVLKYLQEVLAYKYQSIERIEKPKDYIEAFERGNISAAYLETPYLRVFLSKYEDFTVIGETHRLGGFGFVFPKDSPLADDFSEVILQLAEVGRLKRLEKKWFSFTLSNSVITPENERKKDSLSLDSLWALFLFTGCTSTLVLLLSYARVVLVNGAIRRPATVSFEPLRRSFNKLWTMTKMIRNREGVELRRVVPMSSDEGSGGSIARVEDENSTQLHRHAPGDIEDNRRQHSDSVQV